MNRFDYDMIIYGSRQMPVAFIELKNKKSMDESFAMEFKKNVLQNNGYINAPYFLLISQEKGFLWKNVNSDIDEPPTLSFNMKEVMEKYMPDKEIHWLKKTELELVTLKWLVELAYLREAPENTAEESLLGSGFLQAIKGGSVQMGVTQ